MSEKRHVSHIKSSGTTAPLLSDFGYYGEIVVNYRDDNEKLYIKNSNNEVIPFATEQQAFDQAKAYIDAKRIVVGDGLPGGLIGGDFLSASTIEIKHAVVGPVVATIKGSDNKTLDRNDWFDVPTVSYDRFGHIVSGSTTRFTLNSHLGYISGVTNTDEIKLEVSDARILKATHSGHTNGGTASGTSSNSTVITDTGNTIYLPTISYNNYGHITGTGTTTITLTVPPADTTKKGIIQLAAERGDSTTLVMTQKAVTDAIRDSFIEQDSMRYKGVVSGSTDFQSKGAKHNTGDTYKVSEPFTITSDGVTAKLEKGDMVIAHSSGETFNLTHWDAIQTNLDPDLYALKSTEILAGDRVKINSGTGTTLANDITVGHEVIHTNSGSTSPTAGQTPAFGGTANVPITYFDKWGHITGTSTTTITIPSSTVTTAKDGLMSAGDKSKLDAISTGATKVSISDAKTAGDTKLFTLTIDGAATTVYADDKTHTIQAVSGSNATTVTEYKPSAAKTTKFKGDDEMIIVTGDTNGNVVISGHDVICGDYY